MKFLNRIMGAKSRFTDPLHPDVSCIVVGDVHGCSDLLGQLLARIPQWSGPLIFVGDLVDRGENSAGVLRQAMQACKEFPGQVICLLGNHEVMFLRFLEDPFLHGAKYLHYGGLQTLASFGISGPHSAAPEADWVACRDAVRAVMPDGTETWLRQLPTYWGSHNLAVVHAGADPSLPIKLQPEDALIWGHEGFGNTPREDGVWIAHGHTIVPEPKSEAGIISVDTGAYATGRLTAALIGGGEVQFVST